MSAGTLAPVAPREANPGVGYAPGELVRVYVWEAPVRVSHWVVASTLVLLAATGIYIGRPFLAAPHGASGDFLMGSARLLHMYAGIAFSLAVAGRIAWMFVGNRFARWDKFLPVHPKRLRGLFPTLQFYLFARRKPPGFVGHNPLAGLAYCGVFLLYLVQIVTGFALWGMSAHHDSFFRPWSALLPLIGGAQVARLVHHVVMWLLLGFAVHHVYSSLLMATVEQNATVESIFSGYKFVPYEDLIHSGYRFKMRPPPPVVKG